MIVEIDYTNWEGKRSVRKIKPERLYWGSNQWHPQEQWLLEAVDCDKQALRTFAMKDVHMWKPFEPWNANYVGLEELRMEYCFIPTPSKLAARMVVLANIQSGMSVLEPSAGRGAIAEHFPEKENVTCMEILPENALYLTQQGFKTHCGDFLGCFEGERFDRIVMSPPFRDGMDTAHVLEAYRLLESGGRLVSLMHDRLRHDAISPNYVNFRGFMETCQGQVFPIPPGSFLPDSNVDAVVVILDKP